MQKKITFLFFCLLLVFSVTAQNRATVYYYIINDNISKPALRKTQKAVEEAETQKADYLLLELNTFGGELEAADKIRNLLLNAEMPTMVLVNDNAASAGALISIACDSIYMAPGSSFGAASVVNQSGEILPDKYQSYMRSLMRATAEKNGRDPDIAQAMVDPDIVIKGITEKGKVLTFTSEEAMQHHYCEGLANNRDEVMKAANLSQYTFIEQHLSWIDKVINFLTNPAVSGLLIICIVGGIYIEMQSPGIGLPLVIAIVGAVLYFAPHYLEGLAAHWEILLFIAGLGLLILELFVIPGFGIAGISGIIFMVVSLILAMVYNVGFRFRFNPDIQADRTIAESTLIVLISIVVGFFAALWLSKKIFTARTRFGSLALNTELDTHAGYIAPDMSRQNYVGRIGTATTFMRPVGKINIDDEIMEATAEHDLIEKGETVVVTKFENAQLFVNKYIKES